MTLILKSFYLWEAWVTASDLLIKTEDVMEGAISSRCSLATRERSRTALKLHFQLIPWAPGFI